MSSASHYKKNRRQNRIAERVACAAALPSLRSDRSCWPGQPSAWATARPPGCRSVPPSSRVVGDASSRQPSKYLGPLLDVIVAGPSVMARSQTPGPGVAAVAHASQDAETEREVAIGWGFKRVAALLVIPASPALGLNEIAGVSPAPGPRCVARVVRAAADCLCVCRPEPVDSTRRCRLPGCAAIRSLCVRLGAARFIGPAAVVPDVAGTVPTRPPPRSSPPAGPRCRQHPGRSGFRL